MPRRVDITDAALALEEILQRLQLYLRDLKPYWERVMPLIHNSTMRHFAEGGPGWAPLAPKTVAQRIREHSWRVGVGRDQPILQRYGYLRNSLIMKGGGQHKEGMTQTSMYYGTGLKKAIYLQGNVEDWIPFAPREAYSTRLAPRPFLFIDDADAEAILDQGVIHIFNVLGKL